MNDTRDPQTFPDLSPKQVETLADDALRGIESRLTWASLHWGTDRVSPDAWPHVARAAVKALAPTIAAMLAQAAAERERALRERIEALPVAQDELLSAWVRFDDVRAALAGPTEATTGGGQNDPTVCPECAQGKCRNCTGKTLDPATDEMVWCTCGCHK